MASTDTSFLPEDYLEKKQRRRADALCGLLFIIVLGGIGAAFFISEKSLDEVEIRRKETNERYAMAAQRIEQVKQMDVKQQTMARQADLATALLERVPRSNLMAELTRTLPPHMSLLSLTLDSKLRQPPKASAPKTAVAQKKAAKETPAEALRYDVTVLLDGVADTDIEISQYIENLQASDLLTRVELRKIEPYEPNRGKKRDETKKPVILRRFEIAFELNPAAVVEPGHEAADTPATLADNDASATDGKHPDPTPGDDLASLETGDAQ